jgi:hypothetical protein
LTEFCPWGGRIFRIKITLRPEPSKDGALAF